MGKMWEDPEGLRMRQTYRRFRGHRGRSFPVRVRFALLMPFACRWNAWVRDTTAKMEVAFRRWTPQGWVWFWRV